MEPYQLDVVSVRLIKDAPILSGKKITSAEDAVKLVGDMLRDMDREVLCVINLKTDGTPLNCHIVSVGVINQTLAAPRELFKSSILSNAASMIMIHNHPSSDLTPSKADTVLTDRMLKLTELMQIPLVDHIIVGAGNPRYFSFREKKILESPKIFYTTNYQMLNFGDSAVVAEQGKVR